MDLAAIAARDVHGQVAERFPQSLPELGQAEKRLLRRGTSTMATDEFRGTEVSG
jgi:hypothetical protein